LGTLQGSSRLKANKCDAWSKFQPSLGDFGLAIIITQLNNAQTTLVVGTLGYMAPKLAIIGKATTKSNVSDYGALAFEVTCGWCPSNSNVEDETMVLLDCVWRCYEDGKFFEVIDIRLMNNFDEKQMRKDLFIGILCLYPNQMQGRQWGMFANCL